MSLELILLTLLYVHQTMDIVGIRGYVDRPELVSPDTIGWGLLTIVFVLYNLGVSYTRLALMILFGLVITGLYFFHWKLCFFGATEKKIASYNRYFAKTHRIFPRSQTRVVPDTYHTVHTILYFVNFIVLASNLTRLGL